MSAERKQECRSEALHFLAIRAAVKLTSEAVWRGLKRQGHDFSQQEVSEALQALTLLKENGECLVETSNGPLGAVAAFQISGAGLLLDERTYGA